MSSDHLIQHLQQDSPDVLQRLEPVIDHIYRTYLRDALDAPRKRWYVGLTTQYLVQHLLTVYHRRVGQAAVAPAVEAGSVDATLEKTVAESYEGTAWDAFVRRLARELCLAALDTLAQDVGTTGLVGINWLRVLGNTELAQIDQRVGQHLHAIMPLLDTFKS